MNQQVMMRRLMKMKQEMEATQEEIQETPFEASAGGIVTVTVMGTKEIAKIEIDDSFEVESKEDLEMLSDMIIAACNQAYKNVEKTTEEKMAKYQALLGGFGGGLF